MMANVLVTGSKGTLGRALVRKLAENGHSVWQLDTHHTDEHHHVRADVSNYRQMEAAFEQPYDYVYHLAAEFGRLNGEAYYDTLWQTNVIGTRNVLELQRRKGFKLIFASSSEIYGETQADLLDEDLPLRQPIIQHNDYAMTKWVNEMQILNFERRYGVPVVRLRFFNAYGPGERYHGFRSVVCLMAYRALMGEPWTVYEGYYRTFMYMDDFIPTLARVADRFKPGEVYNLGGTDYRSVRDLSDLILHHTGADPALVTYLPEDVHNTVSKRPDNSKAMRDLDHHPAVMLEQGVPLTLDWMRQEYGIR